MKFKISCYTDTGLRKKNNEDSYFFDENIGLFGIADGMGGHAGGEVASKMASDIILNDFKKNINELKFYDKDKIVEFINNTIFNASNKIKEESIKNPSLHGMGTTLVQIFFNNKNVFITNVGDSRCYQLDIKKNFKLISHDHSQIQEYIDKGLITEENAKIHPLRHIITQAIGYSDNLTPNNVILDYKINEYYLLCSDGFNDEFKNDIEIKNLLLDTLLKTNDDIDKTCKTLIDTALNNGGRDNITVMLIKVIE